VPNNDFGLAITSFETLGQFDVNILFKRMVFLDEDGLFERELFVAK
jgi:hypothetical protein